jgi:hypothetical protein
VAWGEDRYGDTDVPLGLSNVVAISASDASSAALKSDGTVVAWGYGWEPPAPELPCHLPCLSDVVALSVGYPYSLALRSDGKVIEFVCGRCAELTSISNAVAIATAAGGFTYILALEADGTVTALGSYRPLDLPAVPAVPPVGLTNVVAIAAGALHSLALKADGTVVAWGLNFNGQTNVPAGLTNVVAITAGDFLSVALSAGGPPVLHEPLTSLSFKDAGQFSCSIRTQNGRVYRLESKHALKDPVWVSGPLVAGTGHEVTLTDFEATDSQRFYRIRRW